MTKLKMILQTVAIFILIMLLICFFVSIFNVFNKQIGVNEIFSKTGLYFLYTIGYGALEGDAFLQNVLAIIGIIALALMSTFLTINLFWRLDDVSMSKTITLHDNVLGFQFLNNGRAICDMKATFVVYDNFTSENLEEPKEYYLPVLLKNSHWNLKVNLDETFWYRAIYDLLSSDDKKLYCIFSFVDTKNGQNSIRVQEVKKEYIMKNEQILKYEDFVSPSIINCNSLQACENGSNVTLNYEENFMNMHYEFLSSADENSFAMCFYNYHSKPLNLGKYNLDTTYIEFSAVSDNKCELKLEFKMSNDVNCAKILELNEEPQTIKIPIKEIDGDLECIREICYTFFEKNNPNKNNLKISNMRIITK